MPMKSVLLAAILAVLATGCGAGIRTVRLPDGTLRERVTNMPQVGMVVRVVNNCVPIADLETIWGPLFTGLQFGESATVSIPSLPFSNPWAREVNLIVKGWSREQRVPENYLGSYTQRYMVNVQWGSRTDVLELSSLRLGNNGTQQGRSWGCASPNQGGARW